MNKSLAALYFGLMVTFSLFSVNSTFAIGAIVTAIGAGVWAGFFVKELLGLIPGLSEKDPKSTAETDPKS